MDNLRDWIFANDGKDGLTALEYDLLKVIVVNPALAKSISNHIDVDTELFHYVRNYNNNMFNDMAADVMEDIIMPQFGRKSNSESGHALVEGTLLLFLGFALVIGLLVLVPHMMNSMGPTLSNIVYNIERYATDNSHGNKHGLSVQTHIQNCRPDYRLIIRSSKVIDVCTEPVPGDAQGRWGFRVWKQVGGNGNNAVWDEVTTYPKDGITTFDDLVAYAKSVGYKVEVNINGAWVLLP